jgi:membrane glycosyltransferase
VLLRFSPELFAWMLPVLAGLVLAIPLSMLTSRVSAGEWARRRGLLRTPEEASPPGILRLLRSEVRRWAGVSGPAPGRNALERVLEESNLRAAHIEFAARSEPEDPLERHAVDGLVLKCRLQGPHKLNKEEQRTVLLSVDAVLSLLRSPEERRILSDPSGSGG